MRSFPEESQALFMPIFTLVRGSALQHHLARSWASLPWERGLGGCAYGRKSQRRLYPLGAGGRKGGSFSCRKAFNS